MVLKKQTVWLLTMLSLIVVLSVYYITTPGQQPGSELAIGDKDTSKTDQTPGDGTNVGGETATSSISTGDVFDSFRAERTNNRSKMIEKWQTVAGSSDSSAVEASTALDHITQLQNLSSNEKLLEDMIMADGYPDALVQTQDNKVNVLVKADSLSNKEANSIMAMTRQYLGISWVDVQFEPVSK